jgi:2,3-bisphosphoglycerate-dependent phosphoglycerate mutase
MDDFYITLLRHGESFGNANGYHQGQYDFPLTELGRNQVILLKRRWIKEQKFFDRVISSPLSRARETAEIITNGLGIPLEFNEDWIERDVGALSGLHEDEAKKRYPLPEFFTPYSSIVGNGEGDWELYLRAGKALLSMLRRPVGKYLVVSHGGLLNQAVHAILETAHRANGQGVKYVFNNTAFSTFIYKPDRFEWTVCGMNDTAHLAGMELIDG